MRTFQSLSASFVLLAGVGACDYQTNAGGTKDTATAEPADTQVTTTEDTTVTTPDSTDDTTVDDTTTTTDTVNPDTTNPNACPVAEELFMPYCTNCHDGELDFPNLTPGSLKYLANQPAAAYPGATLIVPGDPDASLLYRKVHAPSMDEGLPMPPVDEVPASAIETLAQWIRDGAPECPNVTDLGASQPIIPAPGGTITTGALATGFQGSKPAWAESGTCTAAQWWKYQGNTESASMHPGDTCISCHTTEHGGPTYSYAGTVYPNVNDTTDCRGVSGVKVEILDADDNVIGTTTSNTAGNFYLKKSSYPFKPYRARLTLAGRTREMQLVQSSSGDCNSCHDSSGNSGTLGRIVAP